MKLKTFYPRYALVNLILPLNLIIGLVLIILQMITMIRVVEHDGLTTKQFLYEPLLNILEEKPDYVPPQWIGLVAMDSGKINYITNAKTPVRLDLTDSQRKLLSEFKSDPPSREILDTLLASVIKKIPEEVTITSFDYNGQEGIAIYMHNLLPLHMRILQRPRYILIVFAMTLTLFFLGVLQMHSHQRSVRNLIRASKRITNKDLDTEIKIHHRTEMKQVFKAFEQMRQALKANRDRESRFIMSVTHDLKTPLSAMRMYLEAMKDGYIEVSGEAKEAVGKVLKKSSILESRISGMLEFMRLQRADQEMESEDIDLASWLGEQDSLFSEECRLSNRNYTSVIDIGSLQRYKGNRSVLNRALQNLVDNGCRYTGEKDRITFTARKEKNALILLVEDSGPGVDEKEREKIFELFYRGDKGRNSRGMGIGLTSVKSIIESHGGSIICGGSQMGGASFRIELPIPH